MAAVIVIVFVIIIIINPRGGSLHQGYESRMWIVECFSQTSPAIETPTQPYHGAASTTRACPGTYVPKAMLPLVGSMPSACQKPLLPGPEVLGH